MNLFKHKSDIYDKFRLDYKDTCLDVIKELIILLGNKIKIVEFGSGTGKFTELFINRKLYVDCVEPDKQMIYVLNEKFSDSQLITIYNCCAENSQLPSSYYDVIFCAQSFHYFGTPKISSEFYRILRNNGVIVLIWYFSDLNYSISNDILELFYEFGRKQNQNKRIEVTENYIQNLFRPNKVTHNILYSTKQTLSKYDFLNCMLSSSYAPTLKSAFYGDYTERVKCIFERYAVNGKITQFFNVHAYIIDVKETL